VIRFENVSVTYPNEATPALAGIDLVVPEGELCLVVGATGAGKSTLLRAVNGLVPHFTGGTLSGRVLVDGRDTRTHPPRELADVVGVVGQDPLAGFVTEVVEDELAYGMESIGLSAPVMRKRVEETLDLLGLADLRARPLRTLSGGQRQRVAIGSVLAAHPKVLVLDEPTSALDPGSAEEVLAALHRLVHDLGVTVLMAEHRLERVIQYADRLVWLPGNGGALVSGTPAEVMAVAPVVPPVVALGRLVGWHPLPVSVRDARRAASSLRESLAERRPPLRPLRTNAAQNERAEPLISIKGVTVRYGRRVALREISLEVLAGEVVAVMGRNGAGKSTLLSAATGIKVADSGSLSVSGADPQVLSAHELLSHVGLVPQDAGDLLYASTVAQECAEADRDARLSAGSTRAMLEVLAPDVRDDTHPRDLSEGQRLSLVLSIVLAAKPPVVLLDEPTRGLDYASKSRLVGVLRGLARAGGVVVLATHDVELVADLATRVVVLADGEVVADGPTADVVVSSPAFAPQVSKVLSPLPWLTVAEVADALQEAG
jgi:energy-coupling factor transporter ATP-binding protein EcfA2